MCLCLGSSLQSLHVLIKETIVMASRRLADDARRLVFFLPFFSTPKFMEYFLRQVCISRSRGWSVKDLEDRRVVLTLVSSFLVTFSCVPEEWNDERNMLNRE